MDEDGYPKAEVDGFKIGMFVSYDDLEDARVQGLDGSIGTLIWESGAPSSFEVGIPPHPQGRWGTYAVRLPLAMTTDEEAAEYLRALIPELRTRWQTWRQMGGSAS